MIKTLMICYGGKRQTLDPCIVASNSISIIEEDIYKFLSKKIHGVIKFYLY